jgi:hypothetical protein
LISRPATAERREVFGNEGVVALERDPCPAAVGLPDPRRPFDIREQKGHHARRQRRLGHQPPTLVLGPVLTVSETVTATVNAGEAIAYTITYANTGTGGASNVTITHGPSH